MLLFFRHDSNEESFSKECAVVPSKRREGKNADEVDSTAVRRPGPVCVLYFVLVGFSVVGFLNSLCRLASLWSTGKEAMEGAQKKINGKKHWEGTIGFPCIIG